MKRSNRVILILSLLCIVSAGLMIMSLCVGGRDEVEFVPPKFDESVKQGIPPADETESYGWAEISQDGIPYKVAVCGNIRIMNGSAFVFLTNYAENNVWLKLRILDGEGNIVAETGLAKPGEYVESAKLTRTMEKEEPVKLKIMAYEPQTYYSAGSIMLNTTVNER